MPRSDTYAIISRPGSRQVIKVVPRLDAAPGEFPLNDPVQVGTIGDDHAVSWSTVAIDDLGEDNKSLVQEFARDLPTLISATLSIGDPPDDDDDLDLDDDDHNDWPDDDGPEDPLAGDTRLLEREMTKGLSVPRLN